MVEDTLNNEALIEEMLRNAEKVELPSEIEKVIHKGDELLESPVIVSKIDSQGFVFVWDTRTYEKIPVLYYMLGKKLRQRREDGSYRFTTIDPKKKPERGKIKCMLHSDSVNRQHYDTLGFRVCNKSNITNEYQLTQHMKKKHSQELKAIEAEVKERERQEDRELQRLLIQSQLKNKVDTKSIVCDICGIEFGTKGALETHKKEKHS